MINPFAGPSFVRTFGLVFLSIAALSVGDAFLAKMERAESRIEAAHQLEQGRVLMQRGQSAEAIKPIKAAISTERGNRYYLRTLAEAQFAAGKTADAESTLTELLQADATDGPASLIMGRVLVREGRAAEAISYFHRAIDGDWSENAAQHRLSVRLELIDLLAQRGSKKALLAELLPIEDDAPRDLQTRTRMGRLFLLAESPARAAEVFRGILRDAPANADAWAGLGEAEFDRGEYRAAQRDFQAALRLNPGDQAARQRIGVCNELLMLDPTIRGIRPAERFRRSLKLVELTMGEASHCLGQNQSPELQRLLDSAGKALKAHVPAARLSEVSESNLDLAERLWQARKGECKPTPAAQSPLSLVLARLSQ